MRGELAGRVAELRLRGGDLLLEQLRLLLRLGEHRLQLLVVAIERGGPLLILLRLHGDRLLLLGRERDGGRLRTGGRTAHLAAAGSGQYQARSVGSAMADRRRDELSTATNPVAISMKSKRRTPRTNQSGTKTR